jgi:hypothetical protein
MRRTVIQANGQFDGPSGAACFLCGCRVESCSFLKKRTKKLFDSGVRGPAGIHANMQKSFASFLQKRRPSFTSLPP